MTSYGVLKACERCERPVRLIPSKALRASCVSALEYGAPASMKGYGSQETLREGRFLREFGSFVRGDFIVKMSELPRKGVPRSDLNIIASDPDLAAITKDVEALNDA